MARNRLVIPLGTYDAVKTVTVRTDFNPPIHLVAGDTVELVYALDIEGDLDALVKRTNQKRRKKLNRRLLLV